MTYKINGVEINPQPTAGRWLDRELIGNTGDGRPIYEPTRQFEMDFGLLSATGYSVFQDVYLSISTTGSSTVDLPRYGYANYEFQTYSGCYIFEPTSSQYFTQHHQDARLLVTNVITEK